MVSSIAVLLAIVKPGGAWFLKIAFVREVGMHVCLCVHPPGY